MSLNRSNISPLEQAIVQLNESIAESRGQADVMTTNEDAFRNLITEGLTSISGKVAQILRLISEIDSLIARLQRQITELEARQMPDPNPELQAIINQLEEQVRDLQLQQDSAFAAINSATQHINQTKDIMANNSTKPELGSVLETISQNLDSIINSLTGTISSNPSSNPADAASNPLPDTTQITINGGTMSLGELKQKLQAKIDQLTSLGSVPPKYTEFQRVLNAVNTTLEEIERSAGRLRIRYRESDGVIMGGRRRRRTRKISYKKRFRNSRRKNRKTRTTKRRRKQRGGYTYSEPSSNSERKGRGFTKKTSKKC